MNIGRQMALLGLAALTLAFGGFVYHVGASIRDRIAPAPQSARVRQTGAPVILGRGIISIGSYKLNVAFTPDGKDFHFSVSAAKCG